MKMHYLMFFLALALGIIAVVCTYVFGILPRHEHYQELTAQEEQLRQRIDELEKKFSRTQPAAVVREWNDKVQPWAQAVSSRINYFDTLDEAERIDIKVPEEHIDFPKFWYIEERTRRMQALSDEAFGANLIMDNRALSEHEPPPPAGEGWNPKAEEVEEWLEDYERAAAFVREMIDAKAQEIVSLEIWPSQVVIPAPEGVVHMERVGYEIIIGMPEFARYLGSVHASNSYVSVSGLSLEKAGALSDSEAPLRATFFLDRTRFIPAETATTDGEGGTVIRRRASSGESVVVTSIATLNVQYSEEELARIRAASGNEDLGFFRTILRYIGL